MPKIDRKLQIWHKQLDEKALAASVRKARRRFRLSVVALAAAGTQGYDSGDIPAMSVVLRAHPARAGFREAIRFAAAVDEEASKRLREMAA